MEALALLLLVWVVLIPAGVTAFLLVFPVVARRRFAQAAAATSQTSPHTTLA